MINFRINEGINLPHWDCAVAPLPFVVLPFTAAASSRTNKYTVKGPDELEAMVQTFL